MNSEHDCLCKAAWGTMPHLDSWKDLIPFSGLFGNTARDESTHAELDEQSHAARSEGMDGAADNTGGKSGKRAREPEDQRPQNNKKSRRISEDEQRLTGRYISHPSDAKPITMPPTCENPPEDVVFMQMRQAQKQAQEHAPYRITRSKPGASSSYRTTNTLGNTQAGRVGYANAAGKQFKPPSKLSAAPQSTKSATRPSPKNQRFGDGFSDSQQAPSSKRRRTTGATRPSTADNPVDLSSDDEATNGYAFGEVKEVNGKPVLSHSHSPKSPIEIDSQSQPLSQNGSSRDYFSTKEFRNVNQHVNPRPAKRPRPKSGGRRSPSNSSRNQNGPSIPVRPGTGSTHQSGSLDDLNTPSERQPHITASMSKGDKRGKTETVPVIELDKGFDEIKKHKDDHDVASLNGGVNSLWRRPGASSNHKATLTEPNKSSQRASRAPRHAESVVKPPPEVPLRKQYQPENSTATPRAKQSQRQRMQSSSTDVGVVQESPDQLLVHNTVSSQAQSNGRPNRVVAKVSPRDSSPSDLPSTQFSGLSEQTNKVASKSKRIAKPGNSGIDEAGMYNKIPLVAIHSRGCVLDTQANDESRSIDLVWCSQEKRHACYEVYCNGQAYTIPGRSETMKIVPGECLSWHSGNESLQVVIRGSITPRSDGRILLWFSDQQGRNQCYDELYPSSGETLTWRFEGDEKVERTFANLIKSVQLDANREQEKAKSQLSKIALLERQRESGGQKGKHFRMDAEIQYDTAEPTDERQASRRSRMQPNEQPSSPSILSPYFPGTDTQPSRKSTRQSKPVKAKSPSPPPPVEGWTVTDDFFKDTWPQSVMYPPTGARRITVDQQDVQRLDEGEFLNDNLVGFALRRIEEKMAPEHKSKVQFFNSYFFTSLTTKNGRKAFNYDSVKKWTKQNDLLSVPYVVVPINENLHWYVAIICNLPSLARKVAGVSGDTLEVDVETPSTSQQPSRKPSPIRDPDDTTVPDSQEPRIENKPDAEAMRDLSLNSDNDKQSKAGNETFGNFVLDEDGKVVDPEPQHDTTATQSSGKQAGKKSKKRAPPPPRKYPIDQPTIITLDSFGVQHNPQVSMLKNYVVAEAMDKRGMEVDKGDIQGMKATGIPEQSNFCDCGLYLVGYVEEFAKDPEGFINKVLGRQLDRENDFASFDPAAKRVEIRDDLLQLQAGQEAERQAAKKVKRQEKDKVQVTAVNTPAQTSALLAAAAAVTDNGSAQTQGSAVKSTEARSTAQASSSVPSRDASVKPARRPASVSVDPEATPAARESSKVPEASSSSVATDSDVELETAVPRPLSAGRNAAAPITVQPAEPDRDTESAEAHVKEEDGEMLDKASAGEAQAHNDAAQFPARHKVTSPEIDGVDGLGRIFAQGPLAPFREHDSAKSQA